MMTVTESVTLTLVAVRCLWHYGCVTLMAVVQPVSATEAARCVAAVDYPLTVSDVPLTASLVKPSPVEFAL